MPPPPVLRFSTAGSSKNSAHGFVGSPPPASLDTQSARMSEEAGLVEVSPIRFLEVEELPPQLGYKTR